MFRFTVASILLSATFAQGIASAVVISPSLSSDGAASSDVSHPARTTLHPVVVNNLPASSQETGGAVSIVSAVNQVIGTSESNSIASTDGGVNTATPTTSGSSIRLSKAANPTANPSPLSTISASVSAGSDRGSGSATASSDITKPFGSSGTSTARSDSATSSGAKGPTTTPPARFTWNGNTYTANPSSDFIIDGQTLAPGRMIFVSGAQIYWQAGKSDVVIGASTQTVVTSIPQSTKPSTAKPTLSFGTATTSGSANTTAQSSSRTSSSSSSSSTISSTRSSTSGFTLSSSLSPSLTSSPSSSLIVPSISSGSLMGSSPTNPPSAANGMKVGLGTVGAGLGCVVGIMAMM